MLALIWEALRALAQQPAAVPDVPRDARRAFIEAVASGVLPGKALTSLKVLLIGLRAGIVLRGGADGRSRSPRASAPICSSSLTSMFNPLPAIALLPLALIWFGLGVRQHRLRASSIRCCGRSRSTRTRASCRCRTRCAWSAATTASPGLRYVGAHPDSRGVSEHPHRAQDRLGVRVAHADRRGARVRRLVGLGRARLVHLREQEPARDPERVRRTVHRDRDRPRSSRTSIFRTIEARTVRNWGMQNMTAIAGCRHAVA